MKRETHRESGLLPDTSDQQTDLVPVAPTETDRRPGHGLWFWLFALAAGGLAALTVAVGMLSQRSLVPVVPVETLAPGPVALVLAASGRTRPDSLFELTAAVPGKVMVVGQDEGGFAEAGALLVQLDPARQDAAVRQAEAALEAARLAKLQAEADFDRAEALGQNVSIVALDEASRTLARASAEVTRLEAVLDQARLALEDFTISAPIAGTVLDRAVEPGDTVAAGALLVRLADLSRLFVEVEIDEAFAGNLRQGLRADLQLVGHDEVLPGQVTYVSSEVDSVTGGLEVRIAFDDPQDVPIGLTAVVNLIVDRVESALTVPRTALMAAGAEAAVLVLRDGALQMVPVAYVDWPSERVMVTDGLAAGDRVVIDPTGLADGQKAAAPGDTDAP